MATQVQRLENRNPQRVLQIDGLFELITGAGLVVESEMIARWIGLNAALVAITGLATMIVGVGLFYLSLRNTSRQTLLVVAALNLAWVAMSAIWLALDWNSLANEGRWLIAVVADVSLMLALAELYIRRYSAE